MSTITQEITAIKPDWSRRFEISLYLIVGGALLVTAFYAPGLIRFWPFSVTEIVYRIAPLFLISLFIAHGLEVFVTAWRGSDAATAIGLAKVCAAKEQYSRDTGMSSAGIRFLGAAVLVLELTGCGGAATSIPSINPPNAPTQTAFGVLGNGAVSAIVPHGSVTYIGGNFDELAAITGAFARLDAVTAKRIAPLVETQGGEVRTSVSDGNGGFYIGGTFILVSGNTRSKIAHILANGTVDANFNPALPLQDAVVNALAISGDGSTLYVGGGFDFIGGQTRHNLAAVNAVNGTVTNFNPAGLGTDGQVFALEVSGTQVYVGGQFAHLGGQMRNGLAKVAGTTGGDLGWIPNPTFGAGGGVIFAIKVSGDSVYAGGIFTSIGGQQRTNLAKLSATTGAADAGFAPNPNDVVMALAVSANTVYVGGV